MSKDNMSVLSGRDAPSDEHSMASVSQEPRGPILWVLQADYGSTSSLVFENRPVDSLYGLLAAVKKAAEGDATLIRIRPWAAARPSDMETTEQLRDRGEMAAADEIDRLRERLGPRGLEVVNINGAGHYVSEAVKAEIDHLSGILRQIYEQYENQDMSHLEFRVHAARLAAPTITEAR